MLKTIWIFEDNADNVEIYREQLTGEWPNVDIQVFEFVTDAAHATGSPDILFFDLSAIGGMLGSMGGPERYCCWISTLAMKHPGAIIVICSGHGRQFTTDIINEVLKETPDSVIHRIPYMDSLEELVKNLKAIL